MIGQEAQGLLAHGLAKFLGHHLGNIDETLPAEGLGEAEEVTLGETFHFTGASGVSRPEYINRGDPVGMCLETAGDTPKQCLSAAVSRRNMITRRTAATGIRRRYRDQMATVPGELIVELTTELVPALIEDGAVKSGFRLERPITRGETSNGSPEKTHFGIFHARSIRLHFPWTYRISLLKSVFTTEYRNFLQQLINARKLAGLTQREVATRLGKPQSFVSKYENGERRLDVVEYLKVASAIGFDPYELIRNLQNGPD